MSNHEVFDMPFSTSGAKSFDDAKMTLRTVQELLQNSCLARIRPQENVSHILSTHVGLRTDEIQVADFLGPLFHDPNRSPFRPNCIEQLWRCSFDATHFVGTPKDSAL